mmetsp:Transcript_19656/g.41212  ORF Transcript_19656/g.41212 Transcript_19656/m.41212 type:complete len:312 (-) Transcript_19656:239-1174(-)
MKQNRMEVEGSNCDDDFNPDFSSCSIESLLNVPMQIIFRETKTSDRGRGGGSGGKNFILSKSEVSTLLRVSMLSSELDALLSLASDALDKSQKCKTYRNQIINANNNGDPSSSSPNNALQLRALLPILHVHSITANAALQHATSETFGISRILEQLENCANDLSKFGEQNHNMADQLECYTAIGDDNNEMNLLSNEKRAIAELEEAMVGRIESLNGMAMGSSTGVAASGKGDDASDAANGGALFESGAEEFVSMNEFCESLFSKYKLSSNINSGAPPPRPVAVKGEFGDITQSQANAAVALQCMFSDSGEK